MIPRYGVLRTFFVLGRTSYKHSNVYWTVILINHIKYSVRNTVLSQVHPKFTAHVRK